MYTTRRVLLALLSGGGAISTLDGADVWTKDPASWDEKDITRMLSDSPWAQRVDVALGGGGGMGGRGMGGGGGGVSDDPTGQLSGPGGGAGGGMGGGGGGRRGGGMGGGEGAQSMTFTVRWMSALPLKEAVVRSKMGKEAEASKQAKEYLERQETHYAVALIGPARGQGMGGGAPDRAQRMAEHLKEATGLLRKGKQPIRPETVQVPQAGQNSYLFLFPRAEAITLDDKEVEFATRLGPMEIKRKFKLKDMVYQGQLAL